MTSNDPRVDTVLSNLGNQPELKGSIFDENGMINFANVPAIADVDPEPEARPLSEAIGVRLAILAVEFKQTQYGDQAVITTVNDKGIERRYRTVGSGVVDRLFRLRENLPVLATVKEMAVSGGKFYILE